MEELKIFNRAPRNASTQSPKPLGDDAPDVIIEEHLSVLLRFFHLVISERTGGFVGTLTDSAHQLRDLLKPTAPNASTRNEGYLLHGLTSSNPPLPRDDDDLSHWSLSFLLSQLCLPTCYEKFASGKDKNLQNGGC